MQNWGCGELIVDDVWNIAPDQLPGHADLAWASEQNRHPRTIVLENVYGAVSSNGGRDFLALLDALGSCHYSAGALVIDAVHFVPQSRPRLFIVAVREDLTIPDRLVMSGTHPMWTPSGLSAVVNTAAFTNREEWICWKLCPPPARRTVVADLIDDTPEGVDWHSQKETTALITMMSPGNLAKVTAAQLSGRKMVGAIYKRTRLDQSGIRRQHAEVRFDDVAGCLRTPGGGSSRQTLLVVEGNAITSRLLAPREAARLMGLSEGYRLPTNYNDAYHLAGDGVVVPVVRHLAEYLLEPLLEYQEISARGVA